MSVHLPKTYEYHKDEKKKMEERQLQVGQNEVLKVVLVTISEISSYNGFLVLAFDIFTEGSSTSRPDRRTSTSFL